MTDALKEGYVGVRKVVLHPEYMAFELGYQHGYAVVKFTAGPQAGEIDPYFQSQSISLENGVAIVDQWGWLIIPDDGEEYYLKRPR